MSSFISRLRSIRTSTSSFTFYSTLTAKARGEGTLFARSASFRHGMHRTWERLMTESNGTRRIVGHWFLGCSGLVFGIVLLGGITRLTESGLSMVDWSLIHFRPPSTEAEWQNYFEKYQEFPEYKLQNKGMSLEEFQRIYWFEHAHRVYGRLLGLFILLPATFFSVKKWTTPGIRKVMYGCGALVAFQGGLGWWMVKSGLSKEAMAESEEGRTQQVRVSPYRLTAHLGSAFILYLITLSAGIHILAPKTHLKLAVKEMISATSLARLKNYSHRLAAFTFGTAMTGALVAGLDAGLIYNSFPLMGDRVIPSDIWVSTLGWQNLTENPTTVQFIHRCMAISTVTGISALWIYARRLRSLPQSVRNALNYTLAAAWAQGSLGVLTLLYFVPIPLASAHQGGSLALLSSFVWLMNILKRIK